MTETSLSCVQFGHSASHFVDSQDLSEEIRQEVKQLELVLQSKGADPSQRILLNAVVQRITML